LLEAIIEVVGATHKVAWLKLSGTEFSDVGSVRNCAELLALAKGTDCRKLTPVPSFRIEVDSPCGVILVNSPRIER